MMRHPNTLNNGRLYHQQKVDNQLTSISMNFTVPRKTVIGAILVIALLAFEIFNFDTTRYALKDLLGEVAFMGISWASILAIAFCSIDFAGLARLFTPEQGSEEPRAIWYLMGAWLLGATMNAIMTWWAVSLTLLNHEFGNEVLSREELLQAVPIFVATLVWLTRILFIGAFSVAGEHIFDLAGRETGQSAYTSLPNRPHPIMAGSRSETPSTSSMPVGRNEPAASGEPERERQQPEHRRPPMPGKVQRVPVAMQARNRRR